MMPPRKERVQFATPSGSKKSALHFGITAGGQLFHLGQRGHAGVAGRGHGECPMRRTEIDGFLRIFFDQ